MSTAPNYKARIAGLPAKLTPLAAEIHADNIKAGWWKLQQQHTEDGYIFEVTVPRNIAELLCLVHSEISEADEGHAAGAQDDKLPHREMAEVELGDTAIRVLDILGYYGTDIDAQTNAGPIPVPGTWEGNIRLMHQLVSTAMEGFRKGKVDVGCEALIWLLGVVHFTAVQMCYDLTGAIEEKRRFNATREDHKVEVRAAAGGKAF